MMRSAVMKATVIALLTALALSSVHRFTAPSIEQAKAQYRAKQLQAVLPPERIDGPIHPTSELLPLPTLGTQAQLYWGEKQGELSVILLEFVTPKGYSGDIRLLVAVDVEGTVLGARVIEHRETPGLGDGIEAGRSDWILQFNGLNLNSPEPSQWRPDRLGGDFDTLSSATITSSAVIGAIQAALEAFETHNSPQWRAALIRAADEQ